MTSQPPPPKPPAKCPHCGSTDLDGPWGAVWFCDGCGRTVHAANAPRKARL